MVTSAAPATIHYSCSTSSAIWSGVPFAPAMSTVPTVGVRFWNRSLSVIGNGTCAATAEGTPPLPHRTSTNLVLRQPDRVEKTLTFQEHPGELCPRVGFIVTNLSRPAERVVAFYYHRGTAEQYIKEGKYAIKWTRLSCSKFRNNEVRLQFHALAYNLGNFMRTLALPKEVEHWSLTTLREKLVKIGAKVVRHGRYVTFQLAEVAVSKILFQKILALIDDLRRSPVPA